MKTTALALAVLLLASPAEAQIFRYYDNYGNTAYGQYTPYGGYVMTPYGGRALWQNYYRPYGYGYGAGYGYMPYGYGYANGFGYGFGNGIYQPQLFFPGRSGTIPGYYTNGYFVPNW